jgi:hypothetical protein
MRRRGEGPESAKRSCDKGFKEPSQEPSIFVPDGVFANDRSARRYDSVYFHSWGRHPVAERRTLLILGSCCPCAHTGTSLEAARWLSSRIQELEFRLQQQGQRFGNSRLAHPFQQRILLNRIQQLSRCIDRLSTHRATFQPTGDSQSQPEYKFVTLSSTLGPRKKTNQGTLLMPKVVESDAVSPSS